VHVDNYTIIVPTKEYKDKKYKIVIFCAFNNKKTSAFCWNNNCVIINMHGKTTIKIVDAQQAKLQNSYKNTKLKLFKRG
jgi:hypothetical protein